MRALSLLVVALVGCSSAAAPLLDSMDMATAPADGAATPLNLEGRIVALDRQPLAGVAVSLCQKSCRDTTTGAQGEFAFAGVVPSFYTLRARKAGGDYADLDFPLYLQSEGNPRLLPLVLPRVGTGLALPPGPQTFVVDGTLSLTLDSGDLALPGGGPVSHLGGMRIPSDLYPNFCVPSARVLGMWAFAPTGVTSSAAIGVQIRDTLGLTPGAPVSFIEVSPVDGRPTTSASGTVSADGKSITTAMGEGLHQLSWLLVAVFQGGA